MSIDGLDFRSCNRMDSVTKEITVDASLDLSDHLRGLVLKEEQKLAVEALACREKMQWPLFPLVFGLHSGKKCNISFPVVLRHVLNYASGYCVVDVFYSGSRGEVEILYHFQRFRLLKEARSNV